MKKSDYIVGFGQGKNCPFSYNFTISKASSREDAERTKIMKKTININNAAALIDNAFAVNEKAAFRAAYDVRTVWEAWKAGNVLNDDAEAVKTFAAVVKACEREDARKKADKAAAVGLFVDYVKGRAVLADVVTGYEYCKIYVLSFRAEARKAYDGGGINAARAAVADFIKKHNITPRTSTRDIENVGKTKAAKNPKAAADVKAADDAEAVRIAAKAKQADKEAREKAARALTARKADFDAVMELLRAFYPVKRDADKLIRAARKAAFADDNYTPSEFIAAAKAEAEKAAAEKAKAEAAEKAKAEATREKRGGVVSVTVTTKAEAEAEAAKKGGHSVPHVPKEGDGAGAKAVKAAMEAEKAAALAADKA